MAVGLVSSTGLSFGVGLILQTTASESILTLAATGSLSVSTIQKGTDSATLPGSGGLAVTTMQTFKTNPATFAGSGFMLVEDFNIQGSTVFSGAGGLTATIIELSQVQFNASGSLQASVTSALSASIGFAGSGGGV